jgi:hypothetical protein
MSSFPGEKLTMDEIQALEQLGGDSFGVDDLLYGIQPSTNGHDPLDGQLPTFPVAGPPGFDSHLGVVEIPAGLQQTAPQRKSHDGFQLPIHAYSNAAGLYPFSEDKLTIEQMQKLHQNTANAGAVKVEDPMLGLGPIINTIIASAPCEVSHEIPHSSEILSHVPTGADGCGGSSEEDVKPPSGDTNQRLIPEQSTGVVSDPRKEAQRRYRERSRLKQKALREKLAEDVKKAEQEIEALKLEQQNLYTEHTVLQAMIDYKNSVLASAHNAFGNFKAASSTVYSVFGAVQTAVWNKLVSASDEQVRTISKSLPTMKSLNRVFFNMLSSIILDWGSATPEKRDQIERKLGRILAVRTSATKIGWAHDPLHTARVMHNPPVDEDMLANFTNAKACLREEDLLAAAVLTDDQKVALTSYYNAYLDKYNAARSGLGGTVSKLEKSVTVTETGARSGEPIGNLTLGAQGFMSAALCAAELEQLTNEELLARGEMILGAWSVLRPVQLAIIMFESPSQRTIDVVAIYKNLLKLDEDSTDAVHRQQQQHQQQLQLQSKQAAAQLCQ